MNEQNKIDEIKAAQADATPGPWQLEGNEIWFRGDGYSVGNNELNKHVWIADIGEFSHQGNLNILTKSQEYITYLLQEIERKDEALRTMAESPDEWYVGRTPMREYARQALEAL